MQNKPTPAAEFWIQSEQQLELFTQQHCHSTNAKPVEHVQELT
jgi:hypothetical protein